MTTIPRIHELRRGGSLMRLRGLVRKEFLQVVRDPSALAIAFVLPVILLLLFGYGVSLDAEHVPIALVVEKPTADTASFCAELEHSLYFHPVYVHGMPAAKAGADGSGVSTRSCTCARTFRRSSGVPAVRRSRS